VSAQGGKKKAENSKNRRPKPFELAKMWDKKYNIR